jgi:RNA polymerase sigma factor (sigma-70 family)
MVAMQFSKVVRQLRGALAHQDTADRTDADLWGRYVQERDEAAFEGLVRRHGPMVMGVCRRVLRNEQDAEDAFQATFFVLVRRAASLLSPSTLANWLHGVAYRTALEARSAAARRRAREAMVLPRAVMPENPRAELWTVLDQELGRLTENYRAAVVLCDLEGKTRKEAARQLGWAEGTVASRLARGRNILATRLARRGFTGACVAVGLADGAASACVPAQLVVSTVAAACLSAAAGAAVKPLLSAKVITLAEGVLRSMLLTKIKSAFVMLLVLAIAALGAGELISRTLATEPEGGMPATQAQGANQDDLHERVLELKQQLQQMQKKITMLEQKTKPKRNEGDAPDTVLAKLFKYRVPFETGLTQTKEGGRIEIREVWGTRPLIEVGGQYLVRGKYVLPPGERGKLYFYATAGGAWGAVTTTLDLQSIAVDKQEGEFTLVHGMSGPGYFHLYLASPERYSRYFANVYFGTGDNVWREKP